MSAGIDYLESLLPLLKEADLTVGQVTAGRAAVTPKSDTPDTTRQVTPKRHYKPRARRCKGCGELFTPKAKSNAKTCSDRCRKKVSRAKRPKANRNNRNADALKLELFECQNCPRTFLGDPAKHPKYCCASCKTKAYRKRKQQSELGFSLAQAS